VTPTAGPSTTNAVQDVPIQSLNAHVSQPNLLLDVQHLLLELLWQLIDLVIRHPCNLPQQRLHLLWVLPGKHPTSGSNSSSTTATRWWQRLLCGLRRRLLRLHGSWLLHCWCCHGHGLHRLLLQGDDTLWLPGQGYWPARLDNARLARWRLHCPQCTKLA